MHKSWFNQGFRMLRDHLPEEFISCALFFRYLWFSGRYFQRNKEYREGIGEVVDEMPLPTGKLISNVTGIPDIAWYLVSGRRSAQDVIGMLRKNKIHLCSLKSILDFGCGSARVTRHMFKLENSVIHGVDVDRKAIEWCQQHFNKNHFKISSNEPLLEFADSTFDLVYAISVFTHLNTDAATGWFKELGRVITPGGYFIFTTMGENFADSFSKSERFEFFNGSPIVKTTRSRSSYFCRAYHPYDFIFNELKSEFRIVDFSSAGAKGTPGQDLYLCWKK
jgi:SAM-dependent methyltransferase